MIIKGYAEKNDGDGRKQHAEMRGGEGWGAWWRRELDRRLGGCVVGEK